MITKSTLLMTVLLQVALLEAASAANQKLDECGFASVYSTLSEETASGVDTRAEDFTAAHRSLPFGTLVHVNNQDNGRTAVVRITDYYQPYGYQPYGYQPYGYYAPVPFPFFPFIR